MAKYGAAILTIAGTLIGAYFGGPAGASLGGLLGGVVGGLAFAQNSTSVGPRLADTGATVSNIGAPIPRGWGTFPAAGCIIVQTDLKEVIESDTLGGKGQPSQTTETPAYFQTFAIGINDGVIGGVRVIWANGKPIYDLRPQGDTETGGPNESDTAYKARIVASQQLESQFTLYLGTNTQLPDPGLEAFFGVGQISAFRDLAYIVFHDWQNKAEDGNRMPSQWKFEVYNTAEETDDDGSNYSNGILYPWNLSGYPVNSGNTNSFSIFDDGGAQPGFSGIVSSGPYSSLDAVGAAILAGNGRKLGDYITYTPSEPDASPTEILGGFSLAQGEFRDVCSVSVHFNVQGLVGNFQLIHDHTTDDCPVVGPLALAGKKVYVNTTSGGTGAGSVYGSAGTFGVGFLSDDLEAQQWDNAFSCGGGPNPDLVFTDDQVVTVTRSPSPPLDPCTLPDAVPIPGLDGWVVVNGQIEQCGAWSVYTASGGNTCLALQKYVTDFRTLEGISTCYVSQYPLNPALPDGHADFLNETFWTDAYSSAVIKGQIASGKTYVSGGSDDLDKYPQKQASIYKKATTLTSKSTGVANVSDIFSDICKEAGLQDSDLDVTALAGQMVIGYVRTNVMSARDALTPLTQAFFFNAIMSQSKITCRRLAADIVATIDEDELGCVVSDQADGNQQSALTIVDVQDTELPRSVRVHYLSQARDYETDQQNSPTRIGTAAVNDQDLQMPIVMADDQAAQIAEQYWSWAWAGRLTMSTQLDMDRRRLQPVDALALPMDGETQRVVITDITDSYPATRALSLRLDDALSYTSFAVASVPPKTLRPIPINTPAQAYLLDLPLLRDQDNDSGFYTALLGLLPDSFKAASLYRSIDGGGNYTRQISSSVSAVTGSVIQPVAAGPTSIFDHASSILVELYDESDSLNSATRDDVLAGANAAAIGSDGRWEVVQFMTAEHQTGSIWKLTGLLRGRRGTEWAVGTSIIGDGFVILSGVIRTALDITLVNKAEFYKAVGTGSTIEEAPSQAFTGHAVALRPFSPCFVKAVRNAVTGDWSIMWLRRGRIGQTLQSGTDVALSETVEDYEIDVLAGGIAQRTISVSTQSANYPEASQITDFGSAQTSLSIAVYQVSAQIGRGYGAAATFTP